MIIYSIMSLYLLLCDSSEPAGNGAAIVSILEVSTLVWLVGSLPRIVVNCIKILEMGLLSSRRRYQRDRLREIKELHCSVVMSKYTSSTAKIGVVTH